MTDEKKNIPRSQSNKTSFPEPEQIRKQAERRAQSIQQPDFSSMTPEEIQQQFYEMQVKQIEAELQNEQLRSQLEERDDQAALFSIITENMLDMVALTDLEGHFTLAGKAHEILGYEPGFLIGKNVMDFVHPEDLPRILEEFDEFVASGHSRRVECRYRCKDGTHLWLEIIGNFIKDENGIPQKIVFSSRDINERKWMEERLRESEERFRQWFESSPISLWEQDFSAVKNYIDEIKAGNVGDLGSYFRRRPELVWELAGLVRVLDVNKATLYLYRAESKEEFFGGITKIFSKESLEGFLQVLEVIAAGEREFVTERQHLTLDEEPLRTQLYWTVAKGHEEDYSRVLVNIVDITQQRQAEEALRESEERFRVLSEASFEGIVIHENGIIIDVNKTYTELSGYEYDEIIGMNVLEPTSPECHDLMKQNIQSDFEGAYESIGLRKDGTTFPSEIRSRKITYKGRTVRIAAIRDLSKQKKAEEELRRSEEKYRVLFENANEPIYVTQDGKVKFVNPQTEKFIGLSKEELIERPFIEFLHPEDRDMVLDRHKRRISGEDLPNLYTHRIINSAGEVLWVELSTALLNWEARPATLNFIRDITQQKRLESQLRQAQKMEAIGTLAGGIAHDFNNILSSVLGYTELSLDEVEKGSLLHQNLSEVLTAGNRAKDLVKQILAFSRKEEQEFIPTSIVPLVKEALKMLRSTFPSSIEIKENISTEQGIVYAYPTQLHQVLVNLATNAKQAMSDQGGVLEVSVEPVSFDENIGKKYPEMTPGNYIRIAVSDTGCGISEQYVDRIFEPYFTTSETGTGTGLGLSLVHGIVKAHKGHITVYSEPRKGTTFHVYLPLAEQERSRDTSTGQVGKELPKGTESILLVEDEKPIIDMQRQILETLGYHVTSRTSSVEALEAFRANPYKFDLIVTDMTMPDMTGDGLVLKVKEIRPDIPVILCTGFSEKINDQKSKDLGLEGFLMKPVTRKDMAETVRRVLDGK